MGGDAFMILPKISISPAVRSRVFLKTFYAPGKVAAGNLLGDKLEKPCWQCRRNRQGAAAVEFAIVAPVFFLMIFGMIEFGRAIMVQQILTNASREGAREAVVDGAVKATVITHVGNYLANSGITGATVTMLDKDGASVDPSTMSYGEPLTVKVQIAFSNVSWLPAPWFIGGSTQMVASTVMRRETVKTTTQ
jgi:fructose-specific component phosphotransferase system IIB-like protein